MYCSCAASPTHHRHPTKISPGRVRLPAFRDRLDLPDRRETFGVAGCDEDAALQNATRLEDGFRRGDARDGEDAVNWRTDWVGALEDVVNE